jgi:transcriptional regulator with XRE-family HTH domain
MEIGMRIKNARFAAGLSQRQLCGDVITRNMLSLIESGRARPSMDTLAYLAQRLGKPMGYFLDGRDAAQENTGLEQARIALAQQCIAVLESAADRDAGWYLLRGQAAFVMGDYAPAARFLSRAEHAFAQVCVPALEACYRELGDFKKAYEYACKQKN